MRHPFIDLTGHTFGRLTVIERAPRPQQLAHRDAHWKCRCECGAFTVIRSANLRNGNTKSCGCLHDELPIKHGEASNNQRTKEYRAWIGIKTRCYNERIPRFKDYGGRAIGMCDRWRSSFENFLADMGRCPPGKEELDRYPNNDGNYEPGNCRWATSKENCNNRRNTVKLAVNGIERGLSEWARLTNQSRHTLHSRRDRGLSDYQIIYGAQSSPQSG